MSQSILKESITGDDQWTKEERVRLAWLYHSLQLLDEERAVTIESGDEQKWFKEALGRLSFEDRETVRTLISTLSCRKNVEEAK